MPNLKQIYAWLKKQKKRQKIIIKEKNILNYIRGNTSQEEYIIIVKNFLA